MTMCVLNRLSVALALFLSIAVAESAELRSGIFKPPRLAPDFTLQGSDGSPLTLSRYRGKKVVVLGFGFTFCPDVCPTTLANLAKVKKRLGAVGEGLQVVYVTVDPERDSAERMRKYVTAFDPTFIGATGSPEKLADVRQAYGILASKQIIKGTQADYVVHHSSFVYLIDRDGNLRALVPFGGSMDDVVHDIKTLLAETKK